MNLNDVKNFFELNFDLKKQKYDFDFDEIKTEQELLNDIMGQYLQK